METTHWPATSPAKEPVPPHPLGPLAVLPGTAFVPPLLGGLSDHGASSQLPDLIDLVSPSQLLLCLNTTCTIITEDLLWTKKQTDRQTNKQTLNAFFKEETEEPSCTWTINLP